MQIDTFVSHIFYELWLHKLRSSLAIFCIAFGVFSVVMLLALGTGFHEESLRNMMSIVDNSFAVWQGKSAKSHKGYPKGQKNIILIKDVLELPKIFPMVEAVSPQIIKAVTISYAGKVYTKNVCGAAPGLAVSLKIKLESGRFINQVDVEHQARVAVISNKTKEIFFGNKDNGLGQEFLIGNIPFTIIGVLSKEEEERGDGEDVFISYKSYEALYGDKQVSFFFVTINQDADPVQFEQLLRGHFSRKYHFDKNDKEAIGMWGSSKIFQFMRWFFVGVQIFLGICGSMVLAVGSIGVANIMFLIVTERTYEIGLCKAIGATDRQILLQLLFEALVIISIGGFLGISLAFFSITILEYITLPDWLGKPVLSWATIGITIFILALIGLITGFFPARKASKMDPIEALML